MRKEGEKVRWNERILKNKIKRTQAQRREAFTDNEKYWFMEIERANAFKRNWTYNFRGFFSYSLLSIFLSFHSHFVIFVRLLSSYSFASKRHRSTKKEKSIETVVSRRFIAFVSCNCFRFFIWDGKRAKKRYCLSERICIGKISNDLFFLQIQNKRNQR